MNHSAISWLVNADGSPGYTWSPTSGCGSGLPCHERCWARAYHVRYRGGNFSVKLHPEKLDEPLRLRKPSTIGVCLMGDLAHDDVPDGLIASVFGVMAVAGATEEIDTTHAVSVDGGCFQGPRDGFAIIGKRHKVPWGHEGPFTLGRCRSGPHRFVVLTKRPRRIQRLLADRSFRHLVVAAAHRHAMNRRDAGYLSDRLDDRENECAPGRSGRLWPLPNVYLGVSVWDQPSADAMIPVLLDTPAAHRFVSLEPQIGPVDLNPYIVKIDHCKSCDNEFQVPGHQAVCPGCGADNLITTWGEAEAERLRTGERYEEPLSVAAQADLDGTSGISLVIQGCESGPRRRPFSAQWARDVRDQCKAAGVPWSLKQIEIGGRIMEKPGLDDDPAWDLPWVTP